MLIIVLLIMTTSLYAADIAQTTAVLPISSSIVQPLNPFVGAPSRIALSEIPNLSESINFSNIHNAYEEVCAEYGMAPVLVKPLFSLITNVTNKCLHPTATNADRLAILNKQVEKYSSALNTDSILPLENVLKKYAFATLAQAYRPYDPAEACRFACKSLEVSLGDEHGIRLDATLAHMLADNLQHNDELRTIIHESLPQKSRYGIGHTLVMAKPIIAQIIAHAMAHKLPYSEADRALLSWQKGFYKSKTPAAINPDIHDTVIEMCTTHNLSQFIKPIIASQYIHFKDNPAVHGKLAFQLYILTPPGTAGEQSNIHYLATAVHCGHQKAYECAYDTCRELWEVEPDSATLLFLALAAKGHPGVCNHICTNLEKFHQENPNLAMNALLAAMQSDNNTIKRYVLDRYMYIVEAYPSLAADAHQFLEKLTKSTDSEISLQAQLICCVSNANITTSIENLEKFVQKIAKIKRGTQNPTYDEAHRYLARLYELKIRETATKQIRATNNKDVQKYIRKRTLFVKKAQESRAIALRSENLFTRYKALLQDHIEKDRPAVELLLKKGHIVTSNKLLAASKQELMALVEHLRHTPIPEEHIVLNHDSVQPAQINLIIDILSYLISLEDASGNRAQEQELILQAFTIDPSSKTALRHIKRVIETLGVQRTLAAYDEATAFLEKLRLAHPDDASTYLNQACVETGERNLERALELCIKAGQLGTALGWEKAAETAQTLKRPAEAKEYYRNAIALRPDNDTYKEKLSLFAYKLGDFNEAKQLWKQMQTTDHKAAYRLGLLYLNGHSGTYNPIKAANKFAHAASLMKKMIQGDAAFKSYENFEKQYGFYTSMARAQALPWDNIEKFKELVHGAIGHKLIDNETKQEACIALAQQYTFIAEDLEAQLVTNPNSEMQAQAATNRTMAKLYLEKANKLNALYSPRLQHLLALAIVPPTTVFNNNPEKRKDFETIRAIYTNMIQQGPASNYFVQIAHKVCQALDEYVFNPSHDADETN